MQSTRQSAKYSYYFTAQYFVRGACAGTTKYLMIFLCHVWVRRSMSMILSIVLNICIYIVDRVVVVVVEWYLKKKKKKNQ